MPLFMDLHKASDYDVKPTIDEIKHNHIADLKTQEKYKVKFIQYWVNEEAGLVFCLMEGPDKESCIATHQEAHGNMACNVIELQGGDYKLFLGDAKPNEFDIAENKDGTLDTGYRYILAADVLALDGSSLPRTIFRETTEQFGGRDANRDTGRSIVVFNSPAQAIACSNVFREKLRHHNGKTEVYIGISSGHPVTEESGLFEDAIRLANWLCEVTPEGHVAVLSGMKEICAEQNAGKQQSIFKVLNLADERFVNTFMSTVTPMLAQDRIRVEDLGKRVGMSKAQLYRKVTALTGYPPNGFIHELRLRKAMKLIRDKYGNVAQIAFASGFNSPSYFTRSFQERFGLSPASALRIGQ
jgi:AraC-like DNA-binding protein